MALVTRPTSDGAPPNDFHRTSQQLKLQSCITVLAICLAIWAARTWLPPPVPVPQLVVRSGAGEATLEWTMSVDDFSGGFEYQQRLLNGVYRDVWTPMDEPRKHLVPGLSDGQVYVFRVRAVRGGDIFGAPSNEASVVPFGTNGSERTKTGLAMLTKRVTALEAGTSCADEVRGDVRFEHDSSSVLPTSNPGLATRNAAQMRAILANLPDAETHRVVLVKGYASTPGRASYNLDLSESRALAVVEYLSQRSGAWNGEFVALAEGEQQNWIGGRPEEDRRAVVTFCPSGD